uniref:Type-4 uracil-DNA glycosylase n=1 Tax=Thermodesulfobacterium geofontis TaxID=1295609 RepID=A0A7V5XGU6_9BACT
MKEELEKLNEKIKKCKKCGLWKLRNNVVPGEGPVYAKIIVIGQAPGVQEDKTGRPFVGPAGKFLNYLLELAGLKREEVFITSPLKCLPQPPVNRKPKKKEIESCSPWLKKQIEIINPKKFILLGEVAFSVFFPGKNLKDFRGKRIKKEDKEFFVTYHPAAGLRFPKIREILERDFKKLRDLLT